MKSAMSLSAALAAVVVTGGLFGAIPRPEHPKPQFERAAWVNLNGDAWTYEFDFGKSGRDAGRELHRSQGFAKKINVPFCPESPLSGVNYKDFIPAMWYHRKLAIPGDWKGRDVLLHFGAVDYECEIFINGRPVAFHFGGTVSFTVDLTPYVEAGKEYNLVLRIKDEAKGDSHQPRGKQCSDFKSRGCSYTRTTGIWQTVWLEAVAPCGLADCFIVPDVDNSQFVFTPAFRNGRKTAKSFRATVKDAEGKVVGTRETRAVSGVAMAVPVQNPKLWFPGKPYLYDVVFEVVGQDGQVCDTVKSYAGLRKVSVDDGWICINDQRVFQRLVLDQGFYPNGIWTAPSDAALKHDIEMSMAAGFNGARLHQKVFEERFHYWADKLGYLTWGESSSWGCDPNQIEDGRNFITEWGEIVRRDRNHPSIIAWTPFNETWRTSNMTQHQRLQNDAYDLAKVIDPTRPVNCSSGDLHSKTDLWTIHNYARAPKLREIDVQGKDIYCMRKEWKDAIYHVFKGQPYMIDEFGGLGWVPPERRAADNTWGYGRGIGSEEEFFKILKDEVEIIMSSPRITGFCYTQLTDVEQEQNGVYYYDRTPKFDVKKFHAIFTMPRK